MLYLRTDCQTKPWLLEIKCRWKLDREYKLYVSINRYLEIVIYCHLEGVTILENGPAQIKVTFKDVNLFHENIILQVILSLSKSSSNKFCCTFARGKSLHCFQLFYDVSSLMFIEFVILGFIAEKPATCCAFKPIAMESQEYPL